MSDNTTIPEELPAEGRWLGDLATTSLWSHLNRWGSEGLPIALTCDMSEPLQDMFKDFTGDDADPGIIRARQQGYSGSLGWRLARPMAFGDSKKQAALQIADIIAGTARYTLRQDIPKTPELEMLRESVNRHRLIECILPHFPVVDPSTKEAAVNAAILYRLVQKAELGLDPCAGLERDYDFAERQW